MLVRKIISGGLTVADQTAIDAAIKLGIPYGGWIPKGRITEIGILQPHYKLREWDTDNCLACIEQNVLDAKGTLIISAGKLTDNSNYARKMTLKHRRQLLGIDLNLTSSSKAASLVYDWTQLQRVDVLHFIGPDMTAYPNMGKHTMLIVEGALLLALTDSPSGAYADYSKEEFLKRLPALPKTVYEAVDQLLLKMPLQEKVRLAKLNREDLEPLTLSLGIFIKNNLLRLEIDRSLYESCRAISENSGLNEGGAAFVIIEKLWEKLRDTHRLKIVK